ncbi:enolase 1 [Zea mays]|uniref:enolase 1 n=1 Tax=Zea mays TaxID=4577 RepID=UPI0004DE83EE|nr:enolase 1 [Zea mays]XP_020405895.1 enolase 1 [Zea mays]|eukprot:XP_008674343.1 uncharacterized protein LOC103650544 [Zea mays]
MAVTITWVKTRQIFISRGNPTVEVDVGLRDGSYARGAVPSGVSTVETKSCLSQGRISSPSLSNAWAHHQGIEEKTLSVQPPPTIILLSVPISCGLHHCNACHRYRYCSVLLVPVEHVL